MILVSAVLSALAVTVLAKANPVIFEAALPAEHLNISTSNQIRVVNGFDAARNQFPYQVSLQRRAVVSFSHICGGSIISRNWVLSAAHCTPAAAANYRVVAGIIQLNDQNVAGQQIIAVTQIINHAGYPGNNQVAPNDISLVRLATPLTYAVNVQPIRIPPQGALYQGDSTLSGWGLVRPGGSTPNHLQWVQVPIVPEAQCNTILNAMLGAARNPFSPTLNVCSGIRAGGESACNGDSGGPLEHNGLVIGVVSWVLLPCGGHNAPSVYARTAAYTNWITQNTNGEVTP